MVDELASVAGLMGVLFVVLKLSGQLAWSWWWVLAPVWVPFVLVAAVVALAILGMLAYGCWQEFVTKPWKAARG